MNFIFDIGNVLVDFKPDLFLHSMLGDPGLEAKMLTLIFKCPQWKQLDAGTITSREATDVFCQKEPEHKAVIKKIMTDLPQMLTPMTRTAKILPKIKGKGHKLYYISNYHEDLSRYILQKYDFFNLFDGGVFSWQVQLLKPGPEIFLCFLEKYRLKARDCVFFDDMEENVETAQKLGINGVVFRDARDVKNFLE